MKVVLHIGTYKTGTSTLQHFFRNNSEELRKHSVYYPDSPSHRTRNQHAELASMVAGQKWDDVLSYINLSILAAKEHNCTTLLLSSEAFSSLNRVDVEKLISIFEIEIEIVVVVVFRNIYDYFYSTLCQLIKSPDKNLFTGKIVGQVKRRLNYDSMIESWDHERADLKVYSFNDMKLELISSFFNVLGIKVSPKKLESRNVGFNLREMVYFVLSGTIKNHKDHEILHKRFFRENSVLKNKPSVSEMLVVKAFCDLVGYSCSHEKLSHIKASLEAFPYEGCVNERVNDAGFISFLTEGDLDGK